MECVCASRDVWNHGWVFSSLRIWRDECRVDGLAGMFKLFSLHCDSFLLSLPFSPVIFSLSALTQLASFCTVAIGMHVFVWGERWVYTCHGNQFCFKLVKPNVTCWALLLSLCPCTLQPLFRWLIKALFQDYILLCGEMAWSSAKWVPVALPHTQP